MRVMPRARVLACLCAWVVLAGCGAGGRDVGPPAGSAAAASPAPPPVTSASAPQIVVLGDSLSAGLGLQQDQSYPSLLQQKLDRAGLHWDVVNAGVSGDTSADGLARLDWALGDGPVRILILELGANDGLRGLPVANMQKNLAAIIERARQRHIAVLLVGMEAPPNYGTEYTSSFRKVYPDLANRYHLTLLPFLLDRVAGVPSLNQGDGIHPNVAGARIVADTVWTSLEPMVAAASAS